jgi:hypothetical protein
MKPRRETESFVVSSLKNDSSQKSTGVAPLLLFFFGMFSSVHELAIENAHESMAKDSPPEITFKPMSCPFSLKL